MELSRWPSARLKTVGRSRQVIHQRSAANSAALAIARRQINAHLHICKQGEPIQDSPGQAIGL